MELINDSFRARATLLFLSPSSPFSFKPVFSLGRRTPEGTLKRARTPDGEQRDFNEIHFVPPTSKPAVVTSLRVRRRTFEKVRPLFRKFRRGDGDARRVSTALRRNYAS